jgi:hypothetical protein
MRTQVMLAVVGGFALVFVAFPLIGAMLGYDSWPCFLLGVVILAAASFAYGAMTAFKKPEDDR